MKAAVSLVLCLSAAVCVTATTRNMQATALKGCYLRDTTTTVDTLLTGSDSFVPGTLSIRCDVNELEEIHFIKFLYNGIEHDEFGLPRWLDGDSNAGEYVVPVAYLATCGVKKILVQGHQWSGMRFAKEYTLTAPCAGAPVSAPVASVVNAPTKSPVKAPTKAPVKVPTNAPVKAPTNAPVKAPTNAPVKAPTNAPVKAAVKVTKAPTKAPTSAPVVASSAFTGITTLELIYTGATPNKAIATLALGKVNVVNLGALGVPATGKFNINAVQADGTVNSVIFSNGQRETSLPWAYCGNVGPTYNNCADLVVGKTLNVTVIPYPMAGQMGTPFPLLWAAVKIIDGPAPAPITRSPTKAPVLPPPTAPIAPKLAAPQACSTPKVRALPDR
jgi:hypothetical protein